MTIEDCLGYVERAVDQLIAQMNENQFGEMNEATLQHHLALNIHLDSLSENRPNLAMILEKKVRRSNGRFPKKNSATASIDVHFKLQGGGTRCAVELKCFHRVNQREPNNRYDAYADIANLEVYLEEHIDVGALVLVTDHPHYFDANYLAYSKKTGDFNLRQGHRYAAGQVLSYRTAKPYGEDILLRHDYQFDWRNLDNRWHVLVLSVLVR